METSSTPTTILVVEDDSIVSGLLDHALTRRGFVVHVAADGRQAVEFLDSQPPPQAILLDVMLPYVDGFELIDRMRKKDGWATVPIVMLTSKAQEQSIVRALDAGANDYVVKPFRPDELVARIRRLIRERVA